MREKSMSKNFLVMLRILFTRKMIYVNVECPPYSRTYTQRRRNEEKFFCYASFSVSHDRYFWTNYSYRDDHISYAMERPYTQTFISYFRCFIYVWMLFQMPTIEIWNKQTNRQKKNIIYSLRIQLSRFQTYLTVPMSLTCIVYTLWIKELLLV